MNNLAKVTYGVALCAGIGLAAFFLEHYLSVGAVSLAIILGIIIGNMAHPGARFSSGISFSEKHILSFAVALMGVSLDFTVIQELGLNSILIIVLALIVTLYSSLLLAKAFKFDRKFALLLGIGNGVCGSSAIAATEQIIGAKKEEAGLSIAIVNFLGTIGIFLLPLIATALFQLTEVNSGLLIGNTLQAVGQVVAAGFSVGESAGHTATIVKMVRILMLTPLILFLLFAFSSGAKSPTAGGATKKPGVPLFIVGFVLLSLVPTFDLLSEEYIKVISKASHYALMVAMAGIGLRITFSSILKDGKTALLIGSAVFLIQIAFSSGMVFLLLK
jgi:uncharacterized integral membrane protein (TIGR00698 family)